jgi:outer membrane protein TolC
LGKSFGTVDDRENWIVSLGWTFSLGGPGRIEAAEARAQQADISLARFRDRLQASVAGSYQELVLARQTLDPSQRELRAAESALRIAKANYEGGLLPENDLLLAQQGADQARLRRLAAVARFNQAQLQLLAESGVATIDTLTGGAAPK